MRRDGAIAGGLVALFAAALALLAPVAAPVVVDIGPNTGRYGAGFEESEERPPLTQRWTRGIAHFGVPLRASAADALLVIRAARYVDAPATIRVLQSGREIARFEKMPGGQRFHEMPVALAAGPLDLTFESSDPSLGLAIDWFALERARPRAGFSEWPLFLVPGALFLGLRFAGMGVFGAAGLGALAVLGLGAFFARDPFGLVHVMRDLAWPVIGVAAIGGALARRAGLAGWTHAAVLATLILKGSFLFHPSYFYNDVRQNDRYVRALATGEGGLLERSDRAQRELNVAYPRIIGGRKYAFPYSPLFYVPFTWLEQDRDTVVRAIKHVALLAALAEIALVALLARSLAAAPALEPLAAWLAFAFPVLTSRMLFAMWSTLAGHALDVGLVCVAAWWSREPRANGRAAAFFALALLAFSTYVSSLFNATCFALAFALASAETRVRAITAWAAAALIAVVGLYGSFTRTFLTEIVPSMLAGDGVSADRHVDASLVTNLVGALDRVVLFGGWGFALFALAGAALLVRRGGPAAIRAYLASFVALLLLRGLSFGLLKDLKEVEYGAPLLALLAAVALVELAVRSRTAAALAVAGLVGFGVLEQRGHFERWSGIVGPGGAVESRFLR